MKLFCFALPSLPSSKRSIFPKTDELRDVASTELAFWPKSLPILTGRAADVAWLEAYSECVVTVDERLRSRDYGDWCGQNLKALSSGSLSQWMTDPDFSPPSGESQTGAYARLAKWLSDIRDAEKSVILGVDADVVRGLVLLAMGLNAEAAGKLDILPQSWNVLSFHRTWRVQALSVPDNRITSEIIFGSESDR
ncbi:histidine phosphatase family protein [Gluconobacter cerinus]|uniref:histidine phosphatase family protein n=1 Tax=Gluconobacter cerinus TaxID=38307 RepID=UPI0019400B1D|nr:histidine phosphatase family protein [Gluconobacter cerinus]MBM3098745.1 histidine phosphatase family protein [Gluconobacter cerinus]